MPRPFSEEERAAIRDRLLEVARRHFSRFGYRKANVADIAREAGIGKGSFYLFFDSKATAFMAVAEAVEEEIRTAFLDESRERPETSARDRLEHLLVFHLEALDREDFLRVALDPLEAASVFREIPPSSAEAHARRDLAFFEELLAEWAEEGVTLSADPVVLMSAMKALFIVALHGDLVGRETIAEVLSLLGSGVARALAEPVAAGPENAARGSNLGVAGRL